MGWMVWFQLFFLLCMVWFGFGAVLKPLAALATKTNSQSALGGRVS
jgi:hypothetical protein